MAITSKRDRANRYPIELPFDEIKRRAAMTLKGYIAIMMPMISHHPDRAAIAENLARIESEGVRQIQNWDVRCLGKMIERYPNCVPAPWRTAKLHPVVEGERWLIRAEVTSEASYQD
jgi:hypothetical protein